MKETSPRPIRIISLASASLNGLKQLYWSFFSIFGLVYLTDVVGMGPAQAGAIIFASLIFDGLVDLPVGAVLDGIRARLPDFGAILFWSAGLTSAMLALFFALAALSAGSLPGLWILVPTLLGFRLCFSVFDLAENSVAARVMTNPDERTAFASARKIAACLATMALGASVGWLMGGGVQQATRLAVAAAICSVVLFFAVTIAFLPLRHWDQIGARLEPSTLRQRIEALGQTRAGWLIALAALMEACATTVFISGLIYYAKSVYGPPAWAGHAIIAFTLAQILGQPLWLWAARQYGKLAAFAATHGATAFFATCFAVAAGQNAVLGLCLVFGMGVAIGGVSTLRWSIIPDAIDRAAAVQSVRVESGLIGLVISAIQIGAGLSAALLGGGLSLIGYLPAAPQVVSAQIGLVLTAPIIVLHIACSVLIVSSAKHLPGSRSHRTHNGDQIA
jgi:Na+/melibiose symporter-like transporter